MTALVQASRLFIAAGNTVLPWFTSTLVREIRVCAMLGAFPVRLLASKSAIRGNRFAAIPMLHELAVKLARRVQHNEEHA
jgi:hypothetical protein